MKYERIPTRRQPVRKTLYARLFNKTKTKKQRASAASPSADDMDEGGINISRSLTIIFAIHIVAIGMIFIHKQYLSGRTAAPESAAAATAVEKSAAAAPAERRNNDRLPVLSGGDKPYLVTKGDNFTVIARKFNVEESELREMNRGTEIRAGVVLRIPQSQRIVAEMPPELTAIRDQASPSDSDRGLVEILPPVDAPAAQLVRPAISRDGAEIPRAQPVASGRVHTVKAGENIWRISNQYKVSQKELMAINNITDPGKLQIGQTLKLP